MTMARNKLVPGDVDPVIDSLMTQVSTQLTQQFPPGIGFALFVFRKGERQTQARYGASVGREELVEVLGTFVDHEREKLLEGEATTRQSEQFDEQDDLPPVPES